MKTIVRVAYQGVPGAFGEQAIRRYWRDDALARPMPTFAAALEALLIGAADWAVIPIWNSIIGRVNPGCEALEELPEAIVRTDLVEVPVRQCLVAIPGTALDDVRYVGSHPAALAQCTRFFAAHPAIAPVTAFDTAGAAMELAGYGEHTLNAADRWYASLGVDGPSRLAAICSEYAAQRYRLAVLAHDVHDDVSNVTRFAVVRAHEAARSVRAGAISPASSAAVSA
ncbi:MAG TPA: prephenate dehydratase domain-containing protein [Gemmatimonadaceae bacterium]|nr:prephenate dehydratase domain-containing protein [Gemmatimonadaceae bacterium]